MDKIQQIRAEVERQKKEHLGSPECVCDDILSFIDSLSEEQFKRDMNNEDIDTLENEYLNTIPKY